MPPPGQTPRGQAPPQGRRSSVGRFEGQHVGAEPELLTHAEGSVTTRSVGPRVGPVREATPPRGMPTRIDPTPPGADDGGPPLPPGPPGNGGPPGPGGPGRHPKRKGTVRRVLLALLIAGFFVPILAFAIGWMVFKVPTPEELTNDQVAIMKYSDNSELAAVRPQGGENRRSVPLTQVPPHVRFAVMSAEDRSFLSNLGFDPIGIARAVWNQVTGGVGGGSTITQQYIKISTGQDQISLFRKFKEIVLAAKISKQYGKDKILEDYLNTIYFGRGAYGIQAAAQAYFGVNSDQLNVSQGALLAGMIQSPSRWDPEKNPQKALERWNFVLDGMVTQRWLDASQRAVMQFPQTQKSKPTAGGIPSDARGHLYTQIKAELVSKGISEQEINREGLIITTTIDPALQKQAVAISEKVMKSQPSNLRTAMVSVDPRTGAILAYYGGSNGHGLDYAQVKKQPGSSFKPFVMAAALQQNPPIGLGERFDGSSPQTIAGQTVNNSEGISCDNCSLKKAMTDSINTVFYNLAVKIGPRSVAAAAHQAGIPPDLLGNPNAGISLGDKEVHPIDMASAFGTFAAEGVHYKPHFVTKVETADGRTLYDGGTEADPDRMDPQVARNVVESMTDVPSYSRIGLNDGREVAGKTGTVQSRIQGQNNDAWMVGFTPSVSTAVWVGTDDNSPIKTSAGTPIYGRMVPGTIWQQFMTAATRGKPKDTFGKFEALGKAPRGSDESDSEDADSDRYRDCDEDDEECLEEQERRGDDPCDSESCDEDGKPKRDRDRDRDRDSRDPDEN